LLRESNLLEEGSMCGTNHPHRSATVLEAAATICVLPETTQTRKEVILMEYRRPEIIAAVEATLAIEGMKPGGFVDNNHPTLPPKSTGAYLSDE
jgi:hypothetical protein